jgi:hypothetical protein
MFALDAGDWIGGVWISIVVAWSIFLQKKKG